MSQKVADVGSARSNGLGAGVQQEACNVVAATVAAMPLLRQGLHPSLKVLPHSCHDLLGSSGSCQEEQQMRFSLGIMTTLTLPTPKILMNCRCFLNETNSLPTTSSPGDPIACGSSSKREIQRTSSASFVDSRQASSSSSSHTGYRTRLINMGTAKNARRFLLLGETMWEACSESAPSG